MDDAGERAGRLIRSLAAEELRGVPLPALRVVQSFLSKEIRDAVESEREACALEVDGTSCRPTECGALRVAAAKIRDRARNE